MIRTKKVMSFAVTAMLVAGTMFAAEKQVIKVTDYKETIRVACIGDSITFGGGVHDRTKNSYPVRLGKLLGKKWETKNFGRSGATLLKKGELPYWRVPEYRQAMAYKPHVVIIKLGPQKQAESLDLLPGPGLSREMGDYGQGHKRRGHSADRQSREENRRTDYRSLQGAERKKGTVFRPGTPEC
jgi:hypothetical protein